MKLFTEQKRAIATWIAIASYITYESLNSHKNDLRQNLRNAILLSLLVISFSLYNTSEKKAYKTVGNIQYMTRGLSLTLVCTLIFLVCVNYDEARYILSIFEELPSEKTLSE